MKFSILTITFLYGANAATRGGRQVTQRACEPCSHEVCASDLNACPHTNPFVCLEGKAKSGCTAIEDIWLNPEDCHECCDLSSCDDPPPPTCEPCSHDVCASDLNACPVTNPFLCLEGKAFGGCTAIEDIWLNPEDCHECCDLSHCPEEPKYDPPTHPPTKYEPPTHPPTKYDPPTHPPTKYDPPTHPPTKYDPPTHPPTKYDPPTHPPTKYDPKRSCEPCSHEVCASDLNACPHANPFVCLEGKAKSGCTSIEEIWLNPEDCHKCCDLSHCPEEPKYDPPTKEPTKYPPTKEPTKYYPPKVELPKCEFCKHFTETFDTNKYVPSNHPPYADVEVWAGNRLCEGKDKSDCVFPEPSNHRALSSYKHTTTPPPDFAIGKGYGVCTVLGQEMSTLCTEQLFFTNETGSSLEIQGVVFDVDGHQELPVLGGTGCFKNAQGTVSVTVIKDHEGKPIYANIDIYHVVVPDDNGVVLV